MRTAALAVIMLMIGGAASAQAPATTTAGSTGKPQTTTFMQQTLGESFEDFMRISGTKMCASQIPQSTNWCETLKKIEASGNGVVTDSNTSVSVSLVFEERKLARVLAQGKADWATSIAEFTQKYGAPDTQTTNSAAWSFSDGGGISASVQSGNAFTANFYSKVGKPKEENAPTPTAAGHAIAQEVTPAPPAGTTSFRNFVLGANFNDMVSAGIVRAEMCDGKVKGDLKKHCKDFEKIRSGQFAVIVIQDDQTGRVVLNFEGAKLIAVRIQLPYSTSFELQLLELTKKYGNPTTLRSETMQNGYGATWNTGMAFWKMPDGTEIEEMELIVLGDRRVQVDFKCKELADKERAAFGAKQMTY